MCVFLEIKKRDIVFFLRFFYLLRFVVRISDFIRSQTIFIILSALLCYYTLIYIHIRVQLSINNISCFKILHHV